MTMKKWFTTLMVAALAVGNHSLTFVKAEEEKPAEEETVETTAEETSDEKKTEEETKESEEAIEESESADETKEEKTEISEEKEDKETAQEEIPQRDEVRKDLVSSGLGAQQSGIEVHAETSWTKEKAEYPESYDLRTSGVVPAVKENTGDVAKESSVLSALGISADTFKETYGKDLVISSDTEALNGTVEGKSHSVAYTLENANRLPGPVSFNKNAEYVYNSSGTEAIKSELLNGHGVRISYHGADADPEAVEEEKDLKHIYMLEDIDSIDDQAKLKYIEYATGHADPNAMTVEEVQNLIKTRLALKGLKTDFYDLSEMTRDELATLLKSRTFGQKVDESEEAPQDAEQYLNVVGTVPAWAQYTYNVDAAADTVVTIVGWDDHYAKENFLEDHQPEQDGAWIVRSTHDDKWGNEGYFYLSYYDTSITNPESFSFTVTTDTKSVKEDVLHYEFSDITLINSSVFDQPVSSANVFTLEKDTVLTSTAVLTAEPNTEVTVYVYCLNEEAEEPTDGVLLDFVQTTADFGGYHRVELRNHYALAEGSRISVVTTQKIHNGDKTEYVLVLAGGNSEEVPEAEEVAEVEETKADEKTEEVVEEEKETDTVEETKETETVKEEKEAETVEEAAEPEEIVDEEISEVAKETEEKEESAEEPEAKAEELTEESEEPEEETVEPVETVVNGSYVSYDGTKWYIWKSETELLKADEEALSRLVLADLPVFANICSYEELSKIHTFDETIPYMLGNVRICADDDYMIIDLK